MLFSVTGRVSVSAVSILQVKTMLPEKYVDADAAAEFLSIKPRRVLDMARAGLLPGHPLGTGTRRLWRFRLSELEASLAHNAASFTAPSERREYSS
jgi:hypothetical protein